MKAPVWHACLQRRMYELRRVPYSALGGEMAPKLSAVSRPGFLLPLRPNQTKPSSCLVLSSSFCSNISLHHHHLTNLLTKTSLTQQPFSCDFFLGINRVDGFHFHLHYQVALLYMLKWLWLMQYGPYKLSMMMVMKMA